MNQLKLPPYEWLKALPLKRTVTYKDRETGESWEDEEHCQYSFTIFDTPVFVYGRLSYNEDDSRRIYFDVIENGYTGLNDYSLGLKFNKENYKKICKYAQEVYETFYRELAKDYSWQWEDNTPEEYFTKIQ
jgi:hypothetical protein